MEILPEPSTEKELRQIVLAEDDDAQAIAARRAVGRVDRGPQQIGAVARRRAGRQAGKRNGEDDGDN